MRLGFDEQLTLLNNSLIEMGGIVEQAIADANQALAAQDVELAQKAIDFDDEIDHKEKAIEALCLKIIMQQQPVARDLRLVSSVLKIITDLERIGDHAADISEITLMLAGKPFIKKPGHIPQMAAATMKMVTQSIDAFVRRDLELARQVIADDDIVDSLFTTVRTELVELLKAHKASSDQAIDLILIAKYFERIGDHAVNVAEWVVFSLTGVHVDTQEIKN